MPERVASPSNTKNFRGFQLLHTLLEVLGSRGILNCLEQVSMVLRRFSVLVLRKPLAGTACGFISRTLPFGSVASVLHFNRIARLLHRLGLELDIPWTNYYDDYPVVDFKVLSDHTTAAVRALTSLLGFELSLDKELPFEKSAEMLGVVLDLSESNQGLIKVANKPSWLEELSAAMHDIVDSGKVNVKLLPSLFGRALFVQSQFMGKQGKLALAELRLIERNKSNTVQLTQVQLQAMQNLLDRPSRCLEAASRPALRMPMVENVATIRHVQLLNDTEPWLVDQAHGAHLVQQQLPRADPANHHDPGMVTAAAAAAPAESMVTLPTIDTELDPVAHLVSDSGSTP
eukprot:s948_g13.t1